jgi:hypothetical protein
MKSKDNYCSVLLHGHLGEHLHNELPVVHDITRRAVPNGLHVIHDITELVLQLLAVVLVNAV